MYVRPEECAEVRFGVSAADQIYKEETSCLL